MQELPRENPWHLRIPTTEHYQWYKNLVDLHRLTEAWRRETHTEILTAGVGSHLGRKVKESLWMLGSLLDRNIEQFMDDTHPEDLLGRLEHTVWAVQAGTLAAILASTASRTNSTDAAATKKLLEETSWNLGKSCAETRWSSQVHQKTWDLRDILLALEDSPFSGYPHSNGFLVKRAIRSEIEIELKVCAHRSRYAQVHPIADELCYFHRHWMRGFTSALNSQIEVEAHSGAERCVQRWYCR